MTPIGDAISAKDAYDAVKNRDWLSAGLAALTVLPFVPSGLRNVKDVQNLDEPVSSTLLKKYLDKMSDSDPIKKMFKQHKNINAYTKWFNTIPLLGTTALGANAYFNNNKDE